jgi:hypothetical protein
MHAEAVLLVDDRDGEVAEADLLLDQRVTTGSGTVTVKSQGLVVVPSVPAGAVGDRKSVV